jgi:HEAT repeat protein
MRVVCAPLLVAITFAAFAACNSAPQDSAPYKVEVDVSDWIMALGSDDLFASEPAMDGLAALGPNVIPALEAAFDREDASIRRGIIEVLQQIDSGDAVPLLLRAVEDPNEEVRIQALEALAASDDQRAEPIIERALNDSSPAVYAAAVDACAAECNSADALRRIVDIALHDQPFVRISIPRQTLRYILQQGDVGRAQAARDAIVRIALPLLASESDREERLRAALLVADLNDAAAVPALHDALSRALEGVAPNVNAQMQIQAITALGQVGNQESIAILRDRVERAGPLRPLACRALEQMARRGIGGAAEQADGCTPSSRTNTNALGK